MAKKKTSSKRELIDPKRGGKRYVRRATAGKFKESDQVSRSLAADRRKRAKTKVKKRARRPRRSVTDRFALRHERPFPGSQDKPRFAPESSRSQSAAHG